MRCINSKGPTEKLRAKASRPSIFLSSDKPELDTSEPWSATGSNVFPVKRAREALDVGAGLGGWLGVSLL